MTALENRSVLIVGLGGLGCPAAWALAEAGVGRLVLCDQDRVALSNLPRQILYREQDVGADKLTAASAALLARGASRVETVNSRLLPHNAMELVRECDLVVEGADNFATKFLAADACAIAGRPVIHGAAIRFTGTAWAVGAGGKPCYRCLFEDLLPTDTAPNCDAAGVMGPVVGVVGSLMADLALDLLLGQTDRVATVFTFDGLRNELRGVPLRARSTCALCGPSATISELTPALYGAA